jgi:type VI secretion system protein ImpH
VAFLGLFGPHGPLPLHLTDYVRERIRNSGDETFAAFADLFHHRALILFHRAWAQGRPTASRDRRRSDRFLTYVGALCGLGLQAFQAREPSLHLANLHFAGLLAASVKNPDGLRALLYGYFQLPVRVREFMGEWLPIPAESQFRLGFSRDVSTLGRTAVLGTRTFSRTQKFRVVLGPLDERDFTRFLPNGASLARLVTLVRSYAGAELNWDLELIPAAGSATQLRLGHAGRLGFNAVLGDVPKPIGRAHVVVDPFSHQTERALA